MPDKQPFHRDLDVDVRMSEPDFRIGVDEEIVSSLESLHEDLYFVTLDFFDALGRTTTRRRLAAPGKIFPIIHPERRGKPGTVHVLYAGNAVAAAAARGPGTPRAAARSPRPCAATSARSTPLRRRSLRAVVRSDAVSEIELQVDAKDDREAARAADALDALGRLHQAGSLQGRAVVRPRRPRVAGDRAQRDARTRRVVRVDGRVRAEQRPHRVGEAEVAGRHVGSRHQPRRIRGDRRQARRRIRRSRPTRPASRTAGATCR